MKRTLRCRRAVTSEGVLENVAIVTEDGMITAITTKDVAAPDQPPERPGVAVPGFIDLQFNGGFGHDFTEDPARLWEVATLLPRFGVTAFLPTIITAPLGAYDRALAVTKAGPPSDFCGALPLGWHFEGPFLNPRRKGAHNAAYLRAPDPSEVTAWTRDNGVFLVTLAPELPGASALVAQLLASGVIVSAGHSEADFETACGAFARGLRYATHLFNAMPPLHHREPGLAAAVLELPSVLAGIIPDGIHLHPATVKLIATLKGPRGVSVVTDAMAAMGMEPGQYRLGDFDITVDGLSARLSDGTLAGSVITLDAALRNLLYATGWSLPDALLSVTMNPARLLNDSSRGVLEVGRRADIAVLDDNHEVSATWIAGEERYRRPE